MPSSSALICASQCLFSHSFTTYEWLKRDCDAQIDIGIWADELGIKGTSLKFACVVTKSDAAANQLQRSNTAVMYYYISNYCPILSWPAAFCQLFTGLRPAAAVGPHSPAYSKLYNRLAIFLTGRRPAICKLYNGRRPARRLFSLLPVHQTNLRFSVLP
jgi:hypothetical protein